MASGKAVFESGFTNLNTKLKPETKATLDALISVQSGIEGQRELIEDMLQVYENAKPAVAAKARELVKLLGGT